MYATSEAPAVAMPAMPIVTAKSRYEALSTLRSPYLDRARACSALTIPWVVPPDDYHNGRKLPTPFQSIGATGVNSLSSSLLLALFPPNEAFFQYKVEPYLLEQVGPDIREQTESNLRKAEDAMLGEMETSGFRARAHEALRHLLIAGNVCLHWPEKAASMRAYHLDNYVVERNGDGHLCCLILRDCMTYASLDPQTREIVGMHGMGDPATTMALQTGMAAPIEVYTEVMYDYAKETYRVRQEVCGQTIPGTEGTYKPDDLPYIVLRGNVVSGEHYGRGHAEDHLGDLTSLEGLAQAIVEGSAAAARVLFLVNPAGQTDIEEITNLPNGAYAPGRKDDITTAGLDKFADFQVTAKTASEIEQRLALAFLLNTAVQRQAERVTATEIRWVAQQLERGLGGMYSLLSQEFQLPVVRLLEKRMTRDGRLPPIDKKLIKPTIVAGIEAIGRGTDADKLEVTFRALSEILTPQVLAQRINPGNCILRFLNARGVRDDGLIKTDVQVQQENQQAMMAQMVQKLGPEGMKQMGENYRQGVDTSAQGTASPPQ